MKSVFSKVMWVGRATVFMVGLAVIVAVVLGVATAALGSTGGNFILGKANNTAATPTGLISTLADATKSALIVTNKSGGPALDLRVGNASVPANDVAPMKVNSNKVVTKLNADKIDGQDSSAFLGANQKASDSELLDGKDESAFLGKTEKAADSDKLDGKDSSAFLGSNASAGGDLSGTYPNPKLKQPEGFHLVGATGEPTFRNNWSNAADGTPAAFYRDPLGRVYLRGRIAGGPVGGNSPAFELPPGYVPGSGRLDFAVPTSGGFGRVQIEFRFSTGGAFVDIEEGQNGYVSLDGISFRCGPSGQNGCP